MVYAPVPVAQDTSYYHDSKMNNLKIKLDPNLLPILRSQGMNWAAQAQKPFDLQPTSFTATVEGLKPRPFPRAKQQQFIQSFMENSFAPGTICINSAPTDGKAKLLAAWMMQHHYRNGGTVSRWYDVIGGFDCPLLEERANISLLVLNNVGPDSSPTKKEKLRDLLEMYADISKIVVVNGCDPFTFFTSHLRLPLKGLVYLTNASVKGIDI